MECSTEALTVRGRSFQILAHPVVTSGAREFVSGFEEGTLRFFDAVLPHCDRMIDCGAYVGFTALYAAHHQVQVTAFEPSPANFAFLRGNLAANPALWRSIAAHNFGIGPRDERVTLYAKGFADSGSSIFQVVERAGDGTGPLDRRTLLKIDIEGAEYAVLPAISALLGERKPWLHVSFHPFNLAAGQDPYTAAVRRLRAALDVAEATAAYRYMHLYADGGWCSIGPNDRVSFLRQYMLQPKPVPRIASPQYDFIDAVAFSDEALPGGI